MENKKSIKRSALYTPHSQLKLIGENDSDSQYNYYFSPIDLQNALNDPATINPSPEKNNNSDFPGEFELWPDLNWTQYFNQFQPQFINGQIFTYMIKASDDHGIDSLPRQDGSYQKIITAPKNMARVGRVFTPSLPLRQFKYSKLPPSCLKSSSPYFKLFDLIHASSNPCTIYYPCIDVDPSAVFLFFRSAKFQKVQKLLNLPEFYCDGQLYSEMILEGSEPNQPVVSNWDDAVFLGKSTYPELYRRSAHGPIDWIDPTPIK